MIKFFRNVRKSKILPAIFLVCCLIFGSYKLGQLFSHSIRLDFSAKEDEVRLLDSDRQDPWVETVSWKPRVQVMHNLLTVKECEEIIALGLPKLSKSLVVGDNGQNVDSSARTSYGLFFDQEFMKVSPLLRNIEYRIAKWTQIPRENGESFYLLRYELGQQYRPHLDYFGESDTTNLGQSGDRIATVLVYLRTPEEGGETQFPKSENGAIRVPPIAGDAVLFYDFKPDGTPDPRSEHAGLPVIKGTKFSITKWMRAKETEYSWMSALDQAELEDLRKQDDTYEQLHSLHFMK